MQNHSFFKSKSRKSLIFSVKKTVFLVFLSFFVLSCSSEKEPDNAEIPKIDYKDVVSDKMQEQEDSWNEGDLEGFMKHYWKSDSLRFIGKSGLNKGWQKTLDNYKKSYKNKEEMGRLRFTNKSLDFIAEEAIFVIGEWKLTRQDSLGDLQGMYSLIWQKKGGEWVITTDHSS